MAQLLDRLRRSATSYRDLANFSGTMEELRDVDALLETGASTLMQEFEMESAGYFVARGGELHLERAWGAIPDGILDIASQPQTVGEGAIGAAAATRDVVYVPDYGAWSQGTPGLADLGLVSLLCLPVVHGDRVHVLTIASYHRRQELRSDQLTVARAFVRRLEHALERADYLDEIEATREGAFRVLGDRARVPRLRDEGAHRPGGRVGARASRRRSRSRPSASARSAGARTCTTSARSPSPTRCCSSPPSSMPTSSRSSRPTPRSATRCAATSTSCPATRGTWCARTTSAGTAPATRTGSPARPSRWPPACSA